jgi:hypothetical protein
MSQTEIFQIIVLGILAFAFFYTFKFIYTSHLYNKLTYALISYAIDNEITEEELFKMFDDIDYTESFLKWLIDWEISSCTTRENWDKLKPYL